MNASRKRESSPRDKAPDERASLEGMKSTFVLVLMAPVVIALGAGGWWTYQGAEQGLPLLAGGVVMAAFNGFVLKYMFARIQAESSKGGDRGDVSRETSSPED